MSTSTNSLQSGIRHYFPKDSIVYAPSPELVESMSKVVGVMNRRPYVEYRRTGGYGLGYYDVNSFGKELLEEKGVVIGTSSVERLAQVYEVIQGDPVTREGQLGPDFNPLQRILDFLQSTIGATEAARR